MITLNLTKEELKTLMDLVCTGNLVINGPRGIDERIIPYHDMEQKIFKLAVENGLEDCITFDEEFAEYMPTHTYENDTFMEYVDEYETKVFWEELIVRMAERHALNELGDENPDMSKAELKKRQETLEEYYENEFIESDIYHLKWIKPEA